MLFIAYLRSIISFLASLVLIATIYDLYKAYISEMFVSKNKIVEVPALELKETDGNIKMISKATEDLPVAPKTKGICCSTRIVRAFVLT